MKVTFIKKGVRRYAVVVERDRYPDLWCGSIGSDDFLPHDLLHFFAEAEFGLDNAVFGDLARGGNARIFQAFDPKLTTKLWRRERIKRTRLPEGRRSEELAWSLHEGWRTKTLAPALQQKLNELAQRWHELQIGGSLTLDWLRPEGRRSQPPRKRHAPATARRR